MSAAYFDNAATTFPKPKCVYDFMDEFYRNCGGNAGRGVYGNAKNSAELIFETRKLLSEFFHAPSRQVIFTASATIALNMIIQGVIKNASENKSPESSEKFTVYISPFEHNAVTRVLSAYEDLIAVRILPVSKYLNYDFEKMQKSFENEKPDFVIVSHASNVIGFVSPAEKIFSLAKKYHAVTLLDMAQTAGLIDISLASEIFDFAVFAGHKTLYGPAGIGGFVMKKDFALPAVLFGGTGLESENQKMPESLPEKFEAGTQNISGIAGLNAALKWISRIGIPAIKKKSDKNRARLLEIFSHCDFLRVAGNCGQGDFSDIVSIVFDEETEIASDIAAAIFAERGIACRGGLQCAPFAHKFLGTMPAGTVRFSGSYFTQTAEFEALDAALQDIGTNL